MPGDVSEVQMASPLDSSTDNSASFVGSGPRGYRFRKALGVVGRGEDPVSAYVKRLEKVEDDVFLFFTDTHPTLAAISVSSGWAAGDMLSSQVQLVR